MKKKISLNLMLLGAVLLMSAFVGVKPSPCVSCQSNNDLQEIIQRINNRAIAKNGILVEEKYFNNNNSSGSERKIIWQGSYSYCGGECFAIVTVTANCFLGYCWEYAYSQVGNEGCPCGDL